MKKIVIIGSGWYGCHIASILKDKYHVQIIEKNSDIFDNSSFYNQNRLHLGFHYCRNYATRNLCSVKYDKFLKKYSTLVSFINDNYYIISNESLIDYQTFINIYKYEEFNFEVIDNKLFNNIDGNIIKVKEQVIDSVKAYNYFKNELKDVSQIFDTTVTKYFKKDNKIFIETDKNITYDCDILLDCTYNQLELSNKKYIYENTISLLFKKINNTCGFDALTIMDGPFLSLYPRDVSNNIYTLTDVEHTPLNKSNKYEDIENYRITPDEIENTKNKMIEKIEIYYPDFQTFFEYEGYFLAKKTKQISSSDSRDVTIEEIDKNVISVNCGKIYGIFDWEDYIISFLDK